MVRVTIKDVGKAAGVSVATVSNVLNSPDVVAADTRDRVLQIIQELGYQPNRAAQALQQQRTFSIGYRMPSETTGFALDAFLHRMVERAGAADLNIVLFTPEPGQTELEAYEGMIRRGAVDGFVVSGTGHGDDRIGYLLERGFPFVTFGRTDIGDEHSWVDVDGRAGVRKAVDHLVGLGHHSIAFIGWPEGSLAGDDRLDGYRDGLQAAGLAFDDSLVVRGENRLADGAQAMTELLDGGKQPTAVVAVQDFMALGAMEALRNAGIAVGEDIAVVGFDDIPAASVAVPPLTTVRQPMDGVGEAVVEMLLARLAEGKSTAASNRLVEPNLVVRASSRGRANG